MVVDFKQCVAFFRCQHQCFEVQLSRAVAGVADEMDERVAHHAEHTLRVGRLATPFPAHVVNAGNADVHPFHIVFAHVQTTRCVEDVDLATHQQTDAVHLAWNHVHVLEIQQRTRPLNARAVLRHPKHFQTLLRGGEDHLLKAAVGVARCHSMGMYV